MKNVTLELSDDEVEALWTYHHEEQFKCADREDYTSAEHHKRRAAYLRPSMRRFRASDSAAGGGE